MLLDIAAGTPHQLYLGITYLCLARVTTPAWPEPGALRGFRQGKEDHLLALAEGRSVALEEYARQMIHVEELHAGEVDKMLRRPGAMTTPSERGT